MAKTLIEAMPINSNWKAREERIWNPTIVCNIFVLSSFLSHLIGEPGIDGKGIKGCRGEKGDEGRRIVTENKCNWALDEYKSSCYYFN